MGLFTSAAVATGVLIDLVNLRDALCHCPFLVRAVVFHGLKMNFLLQFAPHLPGTVLLY